MEERGIEGYSLGIGVGLAKLVEKVVKEGDLR